MSDALVWIFAIAILAIAVRYLTGRRREF